MDLGVIGLGGAICAGLFALYRWNVANASRRDESWRHVAEHFSLETVPSDRPSLRGTVGEVDVDVFSIEERVQQAILLRTMVSAPCVIAETPAYELRGARARHAASSRPEVSLRGPLADSHRLRTEAPRAVQALLTEERCQWVHASGPNLDLRCERGVITASLPDAALSPERLEAAIELVADLAAVGADLRAAILALEGLAEPREDPVPLTIREVAQDLEKLTRVFRGEGLKHREPTVHLLPLERGAITLQLTYWRGAPGYTIAAATDGSAPAYALRWDDRGGRHGEVPPGIAPTLPTVGGEALLKHDGETLRYFGRGPADAPALRALAEQIAAIASEAPADGPFR